VLYQPIDIKVATEEVEDATVHPAYALQLRQARKSG